MSFVDSEILALPDGTIEKYLKEHDELKEYENFLKDLLKYKPYTLSPETEEVLASLSEVHSAPYTIYQRSKSSDMQFDDFEANGETYPNSLRYSKMNMNYLQIQLSVEVLMIHSLTH